MLGPHVLRRIQAKTPHSASEKCAEVVVVDLQHLWAPPQLAPLTTSPAFICEVRVVPLGPFQTDPRPLEVVAVELWSKGFVEAALQLLEQPLILLGGLPLVAGGDARGVVEDAVSDHHDAERRGLRAEAPQRNLPTQVAVDLPIAQWLVSEEPLPAQVPRPARLCWWQLERVIALRRQAGQLHAQLLKVEVQPVEDVQRRRGWRHPPTAGGTRMARNPTGRL
mmetsp:Transcript_14644/g.45855  ORF Transcript_14644/g.45855 Transcript_14644/m.45855 type:complete len:222 (+) Transcript_14644:268-933(+)